MFWKTKLFDKNTKLAVEKLDNFSFRVSQTRFFPATFNNEFYPYFFGHPVYQGILISALSSYEFTLYSRLPFTHIQIGISIEFSLFYWRFEMTFLVLLEMETAI